MIPAFRDRIKAEINALTPQTAMTYVLGFDTGCEVMLSILDVTADKLQNDADPDIRASAAPFRAIAAALREASRASRATIRAEATLISGVSK